MAILTPIVGVPIEGQAPLCVDGKRLRAWSKGVTIESYRVAGGERDGLLVTNEVFREGDWRPLHTYIEGCYLEITGRAKSARVSCKMLPVPRGEAVRMVKEWAAKERAKMVSTLSKDERRALKRLAYEDGTVAVPGAGYSERMGVPVSIPEFPELRFVVVRWDEDIYTVNERMSGMKAGSGKTGEKAVMDARAKCAKLTPEKRAEIAQREALLAAERLCA